MHIYTAVDIRYVCPIALFAGAGAYLVMAGTCVGLYIKTYRCRPDPNQNITSHQIVQVSWS